jgi:hypothetical protein
METIRTNLRTVHSDPLRTRSASATRARTCAMVACVPDLMDLRPRSS